MAKFVTAAQGKLKDWAEKKELGPSGLAKHVGVNPSLASRWLSGDSRPDPAHRRALRELAGIPERDWETASERERREKEDQRRSDARRAS
jgi:transcriptional regulator with XRE-family HTH domain